jgi:hypothetical protein
MRNFLSLFLLNCVCIYSFSATYRVEHKYPKGIQVGKPTEVEFSIFQGTSKTPLAASELDLEHEKLIHFLGVDSGFTQYLHEHPAESSKGVWRVILNVNNSGNYRFWLQFKPSDETDIKTVSFDDAFLKTPGEKVATSPVNTSKTLQFKDVSFVTSLSLPKGDPKQHQMTTLKFKVEKNGVVIPFKDLDNYLGAKIHVVAISSDKNDFVHSHPGHGGHGGHGTMSDDSTDLHFMQKGFYGIFAQYSYKSVVHTAQFGIIVK